MQYCKQTCHVLLISYRPISLQGSGIAKSSSSSNQVSIIEQSQTLKSKGLPHSAVALRSLIWECKLCCITSREQAGGSETRSPHLIGNDGAAPGADTADLQRTSGGRQGGGGGGQRVCFAGGGRAVEAVGQGVAAVVWRWAAVLVGIVEDGVWTDAVARRGDVLLETPGAGVGAPRTAGHL